MEGEIIDLNRANMLHGEIINVRACRHTHTHTHSLTHHTEEWAGWEGGRSEVGGGGGGGEAFSHSRTHKASRERVLLGAPREV